MGEVEELYQEIIMQHNRAPKNFHSLGSPNRKAEGFNPFCGDQITLELIVQNDVISDIGFQGSGCAISKSSASMMTDAVKTKTSKVFIRTIAITVTYTFCNARTITCSAFIIWISS